MTNDVAELKGFGLAHAHAQNISPKAYWQVCERITDDAAWVAEWTAEAERLAAAGSLIAAAGRYNLARFPFPDSAARREAAARCVAACDQWAASERLTPLEVDFADGRVRGWTIGLSDGPARPLLIVLGGIVTAKEQWVPLLLQLDRLGLAGVVTEMPGVGENTVTYTHDSALMLSAILDAIGPRADTAYAMALSFSGHLALRAAARDHRIKGIVTVGAPVRDFFSLAWLAALPVTTAATLEHLTGGPAEKLSAPGWALSDDELAAVTGPVYYVSSRRDEVIPATEAECLTALPGLRLLSYDEEHAAPRYAAETRAWVLLSVLRMTGTRPALRLALTVAWSALRQRRRLLEVIA